MTEGGYDLKLVEKDSNLECSICLHILKEAMGSPCSHAFCHGCFEMLIRRIGSSKTTFDCPECRETVDIVHPSAFVDRLVRGSKVFCQRKDRGCEWLGTLASFLEEHNKACSYQTLPCGNEGCKHKGVKRKIKDHESQCKFRIIQCDFCQSPIRFNDVDEHHLTCARKPVGCPQKECDVILPKEELEKHTNEDCEFIVVNCTYAEFGCREKVLRKNLHNHNEMFIHKHMSLMSTQVSKINELESSNKKLISANGKLKNEIEQLKGELSLLKDCPAYELNKMFSNGVEKWLKKRESVIMEESYEEWYNKIFNFMELKKSYKIDNAIFIKYTGIGKRKLYWIASENGHEIIEKDYLNCNGFNAVEGTDALFFETKRLEDSNIRNTELYVVHPNNKMEILSAVEKGNESYDCWILRTIAHKYFKDRCLIISLCKS